MRPALERVARVDLRSVTPWGARRLTAVFERNAQADARRGIRVVVASDWARFDSASRGVRVPKATVEALHAGFSAGTLKFFSTRL